MDNQHPLLEKIRELRNQAAEGTDLTVWVLSWADMDLARQAIHSLPSSSWTLTKDGKIHIDGMEVRFDKRVPSGHMWRLYERKRSAVSGDNGTGSVSSAP